MVSSSKTDAMSGFPKSPMRVERKPKWSTTLAVLAAKQERDVEVEEVRGQGHGTAIRLSRRGRDLREAFPCLSSLCTLRMEAVTGSSQSGSAAFSDHI